MSTFEEYGAFTGNCTFQDEIQSRVQYTVLYLVFITAAYVLK